MCLPLHCVLLQAAVPGGDSFTPWPSACCCVCLLLCCCLLQAAVPGGEVQCELEEPGYLLPGHVRSQNNVAVSPKNILAKGVAANVDSYVSRPVSCMMPCVAAFPMLGVASRSRCAQTCRLRAIGADVQNHVGFLLSCVCMGVQATRLVQSLAVLSRCNGHLPTQQLSTSS